MLKTSPELPPNYEAIKAKFGVLPHAIYTYKDTVYNVKEPLRSPLMAHEEVHMKQQEEMGAKEWWDEYLLNPDFRVGQEAEAYKAQYVFSCKHIKDRNARSMLLGIMAKQLSKLGTDFLEAKNLIYAGR